MNGAEWIEPPDEPPMCENCMTPTHRSCSRCGRRICRKCATDHKVAQYGTPEELWRPCTPRGSQR